MLVDRQAFGPGKISCIEPDGSGEIQTDRPLKISLRDYIVRVFEFANPVRDRTKITRQARAQLMASRSAAQDTDMGGAPGFTLQVLFTHICIEYAIERLVVDIPEIDLALEPSKKSRIGQPIGIKVCSKDKHQLERYL